MKTRLSPNGCGRHLAGRRIVTDWKPTRSNCRFSVEWTDPVGLAPIRGPGRENSPGPGSTHLYNVLNLFLWLCEDHAVDGIHEGFHAGSQNIRVRSSTDDLLLIMTQDNGGLPEGVRALRD